MAAQFVYPSSVKQTRDPYADRINAYWNQAIDITPSSTTPDYMNPLKGAGSTGSSGVRSNGSGVLASSYSTQAASPYPEMDFSAYDALAQEIADRYNAAAAQAAAARQRAAQAAYDAMMQNQGNINANSDEAARQAYIQYMNNQKALPQQMAASGLNGGATESSMVGLNTAYGENVNSVNMERNKALKELAAQAAAAKANAEMGIGDIYGNAAMNIANAQQSILTQKLADQMAYERAKYEAAQSNLSSASRSSGSSGSGLNLNLGGYTNSSSSNNGLTYKTVGSGSTKSPVQSSGSYVPLKQYASGVKR